MGTVIHDVSLKPRAVSPPTTPDAFEDKTEKLPNPTLSEMSASSKTTGRRVPSILNRSRHEPPGEKAMPFYCPYCDFQSDSQIDIGDHVVLNHADEHIQRNAQPPRSQECPVPLCLVKVTSVRLLERHVRDSHPDVVVIH